MTTVCEVQRRIVPSSATGAWAGKTGQIASWTDGGWTFHAPKTGRACFVEDEGLGSNFSGGRVRVAIQCLTFTAPAT